MENAKEREEAEMEILNVGLGYRGEQIVVILSYEVKEDKSVYVHIMDADISTKRGVPAEEVVPFHVQKGEVLS